MQTISTAGLDAALEYARKHTLHGLIVRQAGVTLAELYDGGYDAAKPHPLYSGTKSFWGVCAMAAVQDRLLDLDEPVAQTVTEWRADSRKALVTLRQLLNLTSGIPFGGLGAGVPSYEGALAKPLANDPGTKFTYGGIPLQVFGAVLARKLCARDQTPLDYLKARILDPIGMKIASWRTLKDASHTMPTGATLAAAEWIKFGELLARGGMHDGRQIVKSEFIAECWKPGIVNPRYGLGFWLQQPEKGTPFVAYASGSGKQALYVAPDADAVIVHFSQSNSYKHEAFLQRLFRP